MTRLGSTVQANGLELSLVSAIPDDGFKPMAILGSDFDRDPCSRNESMNLVVRSGKPPNGTIH